MTDLEQRLSHAIGAIYARQYRYDDLMRFYRESEIVDDKRDMMALQVAVNLQSNAYGMQTELVLK